MKGELRGLRADFNGELSGLRAEVRELARQVREPVVRERSVVREPSVPRGTWGEWIGRGNGGDVWDDIEDGECSN